MFYVDSDGDLISITSADDFDEAKEVMKGLPFRIQLAKSLEEAREML